MNGDPIWGKFIETVLEIASKLDGLEFVEVIFFMSTDITLVELLPLLDC